MVMRETGVIEATHLSKAFSDTEGEKDRKSTRLNSSHGS